MILTGPKMWAPNILSVDFWLSIFTMPSVSAFVFALLLAANGNFPILYSTPCKTDVTELITNKNNVTNCDIHEEKQYRTKNRRHRGMYINNHRNWCKGVLKRINLQTILMSQNATHERNCGFWDSGMHKSIMHSHSLSNKFKCRNLDKVAR